MTRSHAHRAVPTALVLASLALTGCGGATQEATADAATATSSSSSSSATSAAPSATPSPTVGTGAADPATGIAGTQDKGVCSWVTGEQLGTLALTPMSGPLDGTIVTSPLTKGNGTIRRCMAPVGKGALLIMGTITFDSRADLESWVNDTPQTITKIEDLEQPASFEVFDTGKALLQAIRVADGATLNYVSAQYTGEKAKVVDGKNVPGTDRRPALRALYDQLFG